MGRFGLYRAQADWPVLQSCCECQRRAEVATEASLSWSDILVLDLAADQPDVSEATKAIKRLGLEAVLVRMHFAQ